MADIFTRKRGKTWQYRFYGANINGKSQEISKGGFRTKKAAEIAGNLRENLTKRQLMRTIEVMQTYRRQCDWNVGVGHVLGALAAELEGIL